ncbi:MAG: hypothetical protein EBY17_31520 [Acidobacteriia bacterium]|nr:hypothetical protein [Terriglobia bacterium]
MAKFHQREIPKGVLGHLSKVREFMRSLGYTVRRRDCTGDPGYHRAKTDLEVLTRTHGWLETHSCTYFGEEQVRRLGITGRLHSISCTGAASPRILVPWLEEQGLEGYLLSAGQATAGQ